MRWRGRRCCHPRVRGGGRRTCPHRTHLPSPRRSTLPHRTQHSGLHTDRRGGGGGDGDGDGGARCLSNKKSRCRMMPKPSPPAAPLDALDVGEKGGHGERGAVSDVCHV